MQFSIPFTIPTLFSPIKIKLREYFFKREMILAGNEKLHFSDNFRLNDEIFSRSISHGATDTPANISALGSELAKNKPSLFSKLFLPVEPAIPLGTVGYPFG